MKCKLMVGIAGVLFTCVAAGSSTVDKPCPVVAQELDICAVIANAANYDGKEVTVGGVFETGPIETVFIGHVCPNDFVNVRQSENWRGDPSAVAKTRPGSKKQKYLEFGEVIRGTFRVAREGQCFGPNCQLYDIEESELLCATTNTWDSNVVSRPTEESLRAANDRTEAPASIASDYFPSNTIGTWDYFFGSFLSRFGEPSLLGAAQDPAVVCYRFESLAGFGQRTLAVRMCVNPDGSAKIFVADWFLVRYSLNESSRVIRTSQTTASETAVARFLETVEEANFWAMRPDTPVPTDSKGRPTLIVLDADRYVFEGVRNGNYHVVTRWWQDSPPFSEMVDSLVMDLARLRGSAIPRRQP